jgi:exosome complex component RRP42
MKVSDLSFVKELAQERKRIDGREPNEYRKKEGYINISHHAFGSAMYSIGSSKIAMGLSIQKSAPFNDTPDEGNFAVDILASEFAKDYIKQPDVFQTELSRVTDRAIRSSRFIDLKKLMIKEGEEVYSLFLDGIVINNDGNLFDTANRAALLSILTTKLNNEPLPLNINKTPISFTFAKIGKAIFLDPSKFEEAVADVLLVIGIAENKIVSVQKTLSGGLKMDEVIECAKRAVNLYEKEKKSIIELAESYGAKLH